MPRKPPPGPIQISSPISRPANIYALDSPGGSHVSGTSTPRSAKSFITASGGRRGRKGAGGDDPFGDQATASPTHDYLEAFNTYPTSPDPTHTPIPLSPSHASDFLSPLSPRSPNNDDDGEGVNEKFGSNQYGSSNLLKPSSYPSRNGRSAAGPPLTPNQRVALRMAGKPAPKPYDRVDDYKPPRGCVPTNPTKRRWLFFGVPLALVIIAAVAVGVAVGVSKSNQNKSSAAVAGTSGTGGAGNNGTSANNTNANDGAESVQVNFGIAGSGADGSVVDMADGGSFTYSNAFGGTWAVDPYNPYSVSGRAQSWSPSLLEEWKWGQDTIRGVNLGGWLVTEPFIAPALYEQYQNTNPVAVDEYTLSMAMGADLREKMEEHYKTFITEQDFADIAAAGLNWVRIPIGYWAIETLPEEPFLQGVSWAYFLKAIDWARKYGLRILLDFHALPGSQNGWNHSGRSGDVNWMYGVMGLVNAERHLEQIRSLVEYISQEGVKEVVPMISLVNEVQATIVGREVMAAFYYQAYELIRGITGYGAGNGPIIAMHEGFLGVANWTGFLSGADRLALDQHPYLAFGEPNNNGWDVNAKTACGWGGGTNDSSTQNGITIGGEWSNAINNCGKWLNGVGATPTYVSSGTGTCEGWENWQEWDEDRIAGIASYALANMDALQNWFFWTWKIGNSTEVGYATSPMWHYKLGLERGWMPKDPRVAGGYCGRVMSVGGNQFAGTYPASATGGVPTPTIDPAQLASHTIWPPTQIGPSPSYSANQIALFPTLTQTGERLVMPTMKRPDNVTGMGDTGGWANRQDGVGRWVRVQGCDYPNEYNATGSAVLPTALCAGTASATKRALLEVRITAAP